MNKLICAVTVLAVSTAQAATIHVDAANCPGPGDGTIGDPYCSIQTAIDNAVDTDEIVVAGGTYFETINFLGKAIWLHTSGGLEVTTIDGTGFFHVVQCVTGEGPNTVIDGFTITGGNAQSGTGGGMWNIGSSPTVTGCTFRHNLAFGGQGSGLGGGMANLAGSSPTVVDCTFELNSVNDSGAGMYNEDSSPTVTGCTFFANTASQIGAGMFNTNGSSPAVAGCTFVSNTSGFGGGMGNNTFSDPTVTNCTFSGNIATFGGGMYIDAANATVTDCTFVGNSAILWGGGMYTITGSPTVTNCAFSENTANSGGGMTNIVSFSTVTNCTFTGNTVSGGSSVAGGGMWNNSGSPTVTGCTFTGNIAVSGFGGGMASVPSTTVTNCRFFWNSAADFGGGMYTGGFGGGTMVTNCTFLWNSATNSGGGMFTVDSSSTPTVTNCILWGDSPDEISGSGTLAVTYTDVQGGWPGPGNIDADPQFVDPDNGDYRLSAGSPCIDAGDNTAVPKGVLRDLDGNPRFIADACAGASGATVDMGAYEFQGTSCDLGTMLEMLAAWGRCNDCGTCPSDFDGDCSVGIRHFLAIHGWDLP